MKILKEKYKEGGWGKLGETQMHKLAQFEELSQEWRE